MAPAAIRLHFVATAKALPRLRDAHLTASSASASGAGRECQVRSSCLRRPRLLSVSSSVMHPHGAGDEGHGAHRALAGGRRKRAGLRSVGAEPDHCGGDRGGAVVRGGGARYPGRDDRRSSTETTEDRDGKGSRRVRSVARAAELRRDSRRVKRGAHGHESVALELVHIGFRAEPGCDLWTVSPVPFRGDALRARALVLRTEPRGSRVSALRASIPIAGAPPASCRSAGSAVAACDYGASGRSAAPSSVGRGSMGTRPARDRPGGQFGAPPPR